MFPISFAFLCLVMKVRKDAWLYHKMSFKINENLNYNAGIVPGNAWMKQLDFCAAAEDVQSYKLLTA